MFHTKSQNGQHGHLHHSHSHNSFHHSSNGIINHSPSSNSSPSNLLIHRRQNPTTNSGSPVTLEQVVKKLSHTTNGLTLNLQSTHIQDKPTTLLGRTVSEPIDIPKPGEVSRLLDDLREDPLPTYMEVTDPEFVTKQIAEQIEAGIIEAKSSLDVCEVLIPLHLTQQIAQDVLSSSEVEPCGLRGCVLYLILEDPDSKSHRKIGCVRPVGSNPVPTFELFLTLKQASSGWLTAVSKKIFKTAGRKTVVISEEYALSKRLLYRTFFVIQLPS